MTREYKPIYIITVLISVFFVSSTKVNAQAKKINLQDLKKAALWYSRTIKNDSLKMQRATLVKKEAFSNYFPEVTASGFAIHGFDYLVPEIPTYLPDGIKNLYSAGVTATQPVYTGGKIKIGNKLAELQLDAQKISYETSIDSVMLNTELKFWQLLKIQEQEKVVKAGKVYLNELLKQQKDLFDAGLISESQMLQVKVRKSELLVNELELANFRKIALLDLSLYVGIPFDTTMVAQADLSKNSLDTKLIYENPKINVTDNKLYQLSEKQLRASKLQVKNEKSSLLPQVAVGVNATKLGTFNNALDISILPIAFGTVLVPISDFWGKEKKKIKQKEVDVKIAENNLDDIKDQLTKYITKNWYNLQTANKQIEYSNDKLKYATQNLKSQRDNYNSGLNNLTDLLNARQTKEEAEAGVINSIANFKQKEITYLYSIDKMEVPSLKK